MKPFHKNAPDIDDRLKRLNMNNVEDENSRKSKRLNNLVQLRNNKYTKLLQIYI